MKNRDFGFILIGLVVIISILAWSYEATMYEIVNTTCSHGSSCSMYIALDAQRTLSIVLISIIVGVSFYLIFSDKIKKILALKKIKLAISGEEKDIYEYLVKNNKKALQSELIENLGFTKVKITRILNRLEKKGLIERRRKGLNNLVILKMKLVSQ